MGTTAISRRVGAREAAIFALVLWSTAYVTFVGSTLAGYMNIPRSFFLSFAGCSLVGMALSGGHFLLLRAAERLPRPLPVLLPFLGVLVAAVFHAIADTVIEQAAVHWLEPKIRLAPFSVSASYNFLSLFWLHGLYVGGIGLARALRDREMQLAEARGLAHQAHVAALRFQLNPHFLFNTLNAVSTLVMTRRNAEAETMIGRLCEFLRVSLASDPHATLPLSEELATIEAYLEIEAVRFGDRLQIEVMCPQVLRTALVPGLALQPLVENAVKYAVAPARRPVTIRVEARARGDDLVLIVEDDGDAAVLPAAHAGTGVGLENARRRLTALYGERGGLEAGRTPGGGWRTALRLPLQMIDDRRAA